MICGNKVDFEKDKWEVTSEEIHNFIEKNEIKYYEISAKTAYNIELVFTELAR